MTEVATLSTHTCARAAAAAAAAHVEGRSRSDRAAQAAAVQSERPALLAANQPGAEVTGGAPRRPNVSVLGGLNSLSLSLSHPPPPPDPTARALRCSS